jgi:hypothetical protein
MATVFFASSNSATTMASVFFTSSNSSFNSM